MFSVNSRASAVVALLIAGLFGVVSALFVVPASAEPASTPPAPIFEGFPAPTLVPAVCDASTQGQRVWDSVLPPVAEEGFGTTTSTLTPSMLPRLMRRGEDMATWALSVMAGRRQEKTMRVGATSCPPACAQA